MSSTPPSSRAPVPTAVPAPAPAPRTPTTPIVTVAPKPKPPIVPPSTDTIQSAVTYNLATQSSLSHALIGTGSANISLTGNSQSTNYLQANSGNTTLIAGSASVTTMVGGSGTDYFIGGSGVQTDYFIGGSGNSTMAAANGAATLIGGSGSNLLTAGSGNQSLVGGSGSNTIVAGSGLDTIVGGSGKNLLEITVANISTDSLSLSTANTAQNTLGVASSSPSTPFTLQDSALSSWARSNHNLQTVEDLSGAGNKFLLGTNAQSLGIRTLIAGSGHDTLSVAGYSGAASVLLNAALSSGSDSLVGGGTGNDTFIGSQGGHDTMVGVGGNNLFVLGGGSNGLQGDSIIGGTTGGTNTLDFTSAVTLSGVSNGSMTHVQALSLSGGGNLISNLGFSGIQTITGGKAGGDVIDASTSQSSISINEATSTLGDTLTASFVTGAASTLIGSGTAGNTFNVSSLAAAVVGGVGFDTLNLKSAGTYGDTFFAHDMSVEVLQLTSNSSVTLGGYALATGISTIIGGAGSDAITSSNAASLNGGFTKGLFIDASANTGSSTYVGGAGNDTLRINSTVLASSSINGGGGTNLLELSNAGVVINASVISNFQELSLTGGSNSVSSIGGSGIQTILGGTGGRDTIDASSSTYSIFVNESASTLGDTLKASTAASTLIGSANAGNLFTVSTEALLRSDSLVGGTGNDTLIYGGASLAAGDFAKDSLHGSINLLSLTSGGSDFIFDSITAATGISSVFAGGNGDTLDASAYKSGSIYINAAATTSSDTLLAGGGTTASTLIGSQAAGAGNTFGIASISGLASDSLYGNQSATTTNTLILTTGGQTLNDTLLAGGRLSSIEVLSLTDGGNFVGLGVNAQAAKINYVYGSKTAGTIVGDSISVAGITQGVVTLDGSGSATGDTLAAGGGYSHAVLIGSSVVGATNTFQIATPSLLGNDSLVGSANATDILQITSSRQSASDAVFAHDTSALLNILSLNGGKDTLTLGANAEAAFANHSLTVIADSMNLGGNYIDASGLDSLSSLTVNAQGYQFTISNGNFVSAFDTLVTGDTIIAGRGHNNLQGGIASNANNLFIYNGASATSALTESTIIGGGGTNTLQVNGNAQTLYAASFAYIKGINVLNLTGINDKVTLTGADAAGITTIVGGTGPMTIDGSTYSNTLGEALTWNFAKSRGGDSLRGGHALGNIFQIQNVANLQDSALRGSLTGATATDTLQMLTGAQTIGDSAFSHDSLIGEIILATGAQGNLLTLATQAEDTGIHSVIGGASADTIDASALSSSTSVYIDGSAGNGDSILGGAGYNTLIGAISATNNFVLDNSNDLATSSIVGGKNGNDTLAFNLGTTINDDSLAGVSNIGAIEFLGSGGNHDTLGQNALQAGITTIIGGQGNDTGGDSIDFSNLGSAGVTMEITDQNYLDNTSTGINSTIIGNSGVDTLKFTRDGISVTNADFANVQNIEVLQTANGSNHFLLGNDYMSAGVETIIGGSGADTIDLSDTSYTPSSFTSSNPLYNETITYNLASGSGYTFITSIEDLQYASIVGGSGSNWMYLTDGSLSGQDVTDLLFAGDYNAKIGNLAFEGGPTNATLGVNAEGAGIKTLYLGEDDWQDTINAAGFNGPLTIHGDVTPNVFGTTDLNDSKSYNNGFNGQNVVMTSYAELSNLTYIAHLGTGGGQDSLNLIGTQARVITSDSLRGTFDALVLGNGNNFVQLEKEDNTGLTSIFGGLNIDTISAIGFNLTQGVDLVVDFQNLTADSLVGTFDGVLGDNQGNDTLAIATGSTGYVTQAGGVATLPTGNVITDSNFARMKYIQALALDTNPNQSALAPTGGAPVETDLVLGQLAGIAQIHTIIGGASGDTIDASSQDYSNYQKWSTNASTYTPWNFTVVIPNPSVVASDSIIGAQRIDMPNTNPVVLSHSVLKLSGPLDQTATDLQIGDTLLGSGNISNIQELDLYTNPIDSLLGNSVTLDALTQAEGLLTLDGGVGSTTLSITNATNYLASGVDFIGGSNPTKNSPDVIKILGTDNQLADKDFAGIHNFSIMSLTGAGNNSITLSGAAEASGITDIIGGTGFNTLTQAGLTYVSPAQTLGDTLAALAAKGDNLSLVLDGSAAKGNVFSVANAGQLANDVIKGSATSGSDILNLGAAGGAGQTITDTMLGGVHNIYVLNVLGSGNDVVNLATSGITNIVTGTGNDMINISSTTSNMTLDGGGTGNDTLISGSGRDTFVLANSTTGSYYDTTAPNIIITGTGSGPVSYATNFALITGFTAKDSILLDAADFAGSNYSIGATNDQLATNTHFGLYDGINLVADITTDGHFKVAGLGSFTAGAPTNGLIKLSGPLG